MTSPEPRPRVEGEAVERIANFPALPVDGSPGGDSILLHDVRLLAREVLESRAEVQRLRLEAECLHASDAHFARLTTALHQLRDERDAARLTSDASHEVLCCVLTLTRDAVAEVENTERGWHAHGTEFDPEWPAEYMESGNLQALRARLAALSLPTPAVLGIPVVARESCPVDALVVEQDGKPVASMPLPTPAPEAQR